jgi:hypothetical protein
MGRNNFRCAPAGVHLFTWGVFSTFTAVLLFLFYRYQDVDVWYLWTGVPVKSSHAFAEAIQPGIFRTPANTWSNLGYVLVGLYAVAFAAWDARRSTSDRDPYAVRQPALMWWFGVACIILGIGSGLMHAAMTSWGHKADVFGMYVSLTALIALQWGRWVPSVILGGRSLATWPLLGILAIGTSIFLLMNMRVFRGDIVVMSFIGVLVLNNVIDGLFRTTSQQYRWHAAGFFSVVTAYYIWNLDRARQFTAPEFWLQGHAIWHVLTAVSLWSMVMLYRTELPVKKAAPVANISQEPVPENVS